MEEIKVNKYQTPITEELLKKYPQEVQDSFMEFVMTVPFIKNLISTKRQYAKDRPRDKRGRIVVDLSNPHILENMDYFRPAALHYQKYGTYTNLKPNRNPNSPYGKWIREEVRRCWEGYVRPSDGEWVTGYMYFYLNYVPMMVTKASSDPTKRRASRVEGFPEVWEATYWRFHYIDQARNGGMYNSFEGGNHGVELSKRGSGKAHPYDTDVFTPQGLRKWGDLQIGDYVYGDDGKPTQIIDIPFDDKAPIYRLTLKDGRTIEASEGHLWKVYRHNRGIEILSTKELLSVYKAKRKVSYRNPLGVEYTCGIVRNQGVDMSYQPIGIDPYTMGLILGDGCFRTPDYNSCISYTCQDSDAGYIIPLIPYEVKKKKTKYSYSIVIPDAAKYLDALGLWMHKSEDKFIPEVYLHNSREVRKELLMGLIDSDGYVSNASHPMNGYQISVSSKRFADDIIWLCRSLGYNVSNASKHPWYYNKNKERVYGLTSYRINIYTDDVLSNLPRKNNVCSNSVYSRSKQNSTRIVNIEYVGEKQAKCITVDNVSHCYLVGDFITTHNSFVLASIMAHNLLLGESSEAHKRTTTILTAYLREYLAEKDGTFSKFTPIKSFLAEHTQFPRRMLTDSPNKMSWKSGYKDKLTGADMGDQNIVLGLSSKDDVGKIRGKRGYILFEEFGSFPNLIEIYNNVRDGMKEGKYVYGFAYLVGCVCADTMVWTINGRNIPIQQLQKEDGIIGYSSQAGYDEYKGIYSTGVTKEPIAKMLEPHTKECVEITLSSGNILRCSIDHPVLTLTKHTPRIKGTNCRNIYYTSDFVRAKDLKVGQRVCELREIGVFGDDTLFDARFVGMMIGDGTYRYDDTPKYCSEDAELQAYVEDKYDTTCYKSNVGKSGKTYKEYRVRNICPKLRQIGIFGQVKKDKRLPSNYQTLTKEDSALLLSGLYDTDGSVFFKGRDSAAYLVQSNREILEQVQLLWRKFGVNCSISEIHPHSKSHLVHGHLIKNNGSWFTLTIAGRENLPNAAKTLSLLVPYKAKTLKECADWFAHNKSLTPSRQPKEYITHKIVSIKSIGEQTVYNLSAAFSHTYLANNIITHNTAGDKDSDFHGAQELVYNPKGYDVYAIPNVWDKPNQGRPLFAFFTPAYVNLKGFYNKDGVSDVVGGLLHLLTDRYKAKYETGDPRTIIKVVSNMPVTPAEAIIQGGISQFPVTDIEARLLEIKSNPNFYDNTYVGQFAITDNKVEFVPTSDTPIRYFQQKDNKNMPGAVEIYEMPQLDSSGKVYENRYIAGADPYDNDESTTTSLGSILMLDLWTDRIVAEYTGRPQMADDYFEICRRMCLFYNARLNYENNKKGLFSHFSTMNSTYLLTDVLEILVDKQMMKPGGYGNTAKGTNASQAINGWARQLINKWLLTPQTTIVTENNEEKEVTKHNLNFIKNMALLIELSQWNPLGNFDRVSALGMLMLLREDKLRLMGGKFDREKQEEKDPNDPQNDDFFKDNYPYEEE